MEFGRTDRAVPIRLLIIASALFAATLCGIWLLAVPVGPLVCPAVLPPPSNCIEDYRAGNAVVVSLCAVVAYALTLVVALMGQRPLVRAGVAVLAVAPIASYVVVAFLPGLRPVG